MARPHKLIAACGWPPMRQWWQIINRQEREAKCKERAEQKARDKRRPKCKCAAYPWPHRPGGGFCRHPDPPLECWKPKAGPRKYRNRNVGLRRQIARSNGLHPIKDRAKIAELMPLIFGEAKYLKHKHPKVLYRNIEFVDDEPIGHLPRSGPN